MPTYGGHENLDDAAFAALWQLVHQPRANKQEYMNILGERDGRHYRHEIQTQGEKYKSSWAGPAVGRLSGIVHNHPTRDRPDAALGFSETDMRTSNENRVPSYITTIGENHYRKYVPGEKPTYKGTPGVEFLAQFPIEEMKQMIALRIRNSNHSQAMKMRLLQNLLTPTPTTTTK